MSYEDTKLHLINVYMSTLSVIELNLSLEDFISIWGKSLGTRIWKHEGPNLLNIWRSGLSWEEKNALGRYLIEKSSVKKN